MTEIEKNLRHLMLHREKLNIGGFRDLMTQILTQIPSVGWELGSDPNNPNRDILSLTTGGDLKELTKLNSFLSLPIETEDWDIIIGIPPRDWERCFEISMESGEIFNINASSWYWSSEWRKESMSLSLYIPDKEFLKSDVLEEAAKVLAVGELGESNVYKYIQNMTYNVLPIPTKLNQQRINSLRKEFVEHYPNCHFATFLKKPNFRIDVVE